MQNAAYHAGLHCLPKHPFIGFLVFTGLNDVIIVTFMVSTLVSKQRSIQSCVSLYSATCLNRPLSKRQKKMVFKTNCRLMQVKSIAECSMGMGSILQYFRPSLSYHLSHRPLFCLFLSGSFTQVLLYNIWWQLNCY